MSTRPEATDGGTLDIQEGAVDWTGTTPTAGVALHDVSWFARSYEHATWEPSASVVPITLPAFPSMTTS